MTKSERLVAEKNGTLDALYAARVHTLVRMRYTQSAAEAIINNYLASPDDEKYKGEFVAMQAYRAECKAQARAEVYGEEGVS